VCVIKKHNKSKRVLEQTKRYIAYSLDSCIHAVDLERNPTGKTSAIFDLRGEARSHMLPKGNSPSTHNHDLVVCVTQMLCRSGF